jgi:hypothetical protein
MRQAEDAVVAAAAEVGGQEPLYACVESAYVSIRGVSICVESAYVSIRQHEWLLPPHIYACVEWLKAACTSSLRPHTLVA